MRNTIHNCVSMILDYYSKNTDDGMKLDFDDIPFSEKVELAGLMLEEDKLVLEFINDGDRYSDIQCALAAFFIKRNEKTRENLEEELDRALVEYYEERMKVLINRAVNEQEENYYEDRGYSKYGDRDTGEIEYRRSL